MSGVEVKKFIFMVHNLGFGCIEAYAVPLERIKRGHLRETYRLFEKLLPDHPDEKNTVIYVLKGGINAWGYDALWTCSHFECTESASLGRLQAIADEFRFDVEGTDSFIEMLDGHRELLVIEVYDISNKIARWLISKGTPVKDFKE